MESRELNKMSATNDYRQKIYNKKVEKTKKLIARGQNNSRKFKKSILGRKLFDEDIPDADQPKRKRKTAAAIHVTPQEKQNLQTKLSQLYLQ